MNGMQAYLGEMGMVHQVAPDRVGVNVNGNFMWLNPMLLEEFWELKEGDKVCEMKRVGGEKGEKGRRGEKGREGERRGREREDGGFIY